MTESPKMQFIQLAMFFGTLALVTGQAVNPMMYGIGQYMNPYYTGFYGGYGNMGHMNPLGYQISSGMAIPGMGGGNMGGMGQQGGMYGGGFYGASSRLCIISPLSLLFVVFLGFFAL